MAHQNDDSALINLRQIMKIGEERMEAERVARSAESRRQAEHAARQERAAAERRASEAEARKREAEALARRTEAKMEAERIDRELQLRLEIAERARAEEHRARLEHAERMAQIELQSSRRTVSWPTAVTLLVAACATVLGGAVAAHSHTQSQETIGRIRATEAIASTRYTAPTMPSVRRPPSAPVVAPPPVAETTPSRVVSRRGSRRGQQSTTGTQNGSQPHGDLGRLLDGPDLVSQHGGLEGGRSARRGGHR
jgi:hypothetical protein